MINASCTWHLATRLLGEMQLFNHILKQRVWVQFHLFLFFGLYLFLQVWEQSIIKKKEHSQLKKKKEREGKRKFQKEINNCVFLPWKVTHDKIPSLKEQKSKQGLHLVSSLNTRVYVHSPCCTATSFQACLSACRCPREHFFPVFLRRSGCFLEGWMMEKWRILHPDWH